MPNQEELKNMPDLTTDTDLKSELLKEPETPNYIPEIAKEVPAEEAPKTNFRAKGTIDFSIEYSGDDLKVASTPSDEAALVHIFNSLMRLRNVKAEMMDKNNKRKYTSIEKQDVYATVRVLNKLTIALSQKTYKSIMISNMSPEEREAYHQANEQAIMDQMEKHRLLDERYKSYKLRAGVPGKKSQSELDWLKHEFMQIKRERRNLI